MTNKTTILAEIDEKYDNDGFVLDFASEPVPISELKNVISDSIDSLLKSVEEKCEEMKKQKTSDRQLIHNDHTVEYIKYYENDSDPKYNEALQDIKSSIKSLYE
jgi:hypothetical protein